MAELYLGGRRILDGMVIEVEERTRLDFLINSKESAELVLAGERVPLDRVSDGFRSSRTWLSTQRTRHFVGDCPIRMCVGSLELRALLRRLPSRIELDDYEYMLRTLWSRLGPAAVEDPLGRVQIWARLAPEIPAAEEERARVLLSLFARSASSLRAIGASPRRSLREEDEWVPLREVQKVRGRIDGRRLRPWDPPRPADRPPRGSVLVRRRTDDVDSPENRYVVAVVRQLAGMLRAALQESPSSQTAVEITAALNDLALWFGHSDWQEIPPGPVPHHSFVLRDDPEYGVVATLAVHLNSLPGVLARFPPDDPHRLFPLSPYSLNALYERWVQLSVFDWIVDRLGGPPRDFEPEGTWQWRLPAGHVVLRIDVPYPRRADAGIVAIDKNRPDVAVEIWRSDHVEVLTLDATYSQDPLLHDEKLSYARNLRNVGLRHPVTNDPPLVVRWAAVARPAHVAAVVELGAGLSRATLSLPPREESQALLERFLSATVGETLFE